MELADGKHEITAVIDYDSYGDRIGGHLHWSIPKGYAGKRYFHFTHDGTSIPCDISKIAITQTVVNQLNYVPLYRENVKDLTIFGTFDNTTVILNSNSGEVRTGAQITLTALGGDVVNPCIRANSKEYIKFNTTLKGGHVLVINTMYAEKDATDITTGQSFLPYLDLGSTFIQVPIGDSNFTTE